MKDADLAELDQLEAEHREAGKAYKAAAADLAHDATPAGHRALAAGYALLVALIRIRRQTKGTTQ